MVQPVFDERDTEILDKTLNLRMRLMGVFDKKQDSELPVKPSELLAIAQLAGSIDKTVIDRAKVRSNDQNNQSQEKERALLLALMQQMHNNKSSQNSQLVHEMPSFESNTTLNISDGELVRGQDSVELPTEEN
jgi:hypothetical protein